MYWSFVSSADKTPNAISIHQHAVNSVLATIDLMICGVPIRLLHFIYAAGYGVFYIMVTLILHGLGKQSRFYVGLMDWKEYPGKSVWISLGVLLIGTPILHCVSYFIYLLREKIREALVDNGEACSEGSEAVASGTELLNAGERGH